MTSTVEACTMRKGRFSPQTKQQKQGWFSARKTNKDFFPVVFRCFGCKSALVSPLGCKRWIGESMEKPAFLKLVRKRCEEVWPLPRWKIIASGVYPVSDLYIVFIYDVYLMRIKLRCMVTAEVALCQLCQLGSDYSLHLQGTSDPQWSLSLCKRAMGGEDQSFDCQLKPANSSLTCCYSISRNHGSEKWVPSIVVTF